MALLLAACGTTAQPIPQNGIQQPTPTFAPAFQLGDGPALVPTPELQRSMTNVLTQQSPEERREQFEEVVIYDDTLHSDWSAENSFGMRSDLTSSIYVHSGIRAGAITPVVATGDFLLTVRQGAATQYRREDVVGVSFWINGGENYIDPDDLVSAVIGSNQYPYWVQNDASVQLSGRVTQPDAPLFSPTRLYYLGINRSIPPETWVEAINWLDYRIFDPDYTYVTGIYIRNDSSFFDTVYVDRITLLLERR